LELISFVGLSVRRVFHASGFHREEEPVPISVNRQLYRAIKQTSDADGVNKTITKFLEA
jgi:hypothetical protein